MPRCRKILANGKRCKAHAMAGSKFCLFHTPGQKMKRRKKSAAAKSERIGYDDKGRKKLWRRTTENQIAVRGTKALGTALVARGTQLKNKPDYTVKVTHHKARYNRQGTVMVGAHTQRTIEPTLSDRGRNFQQTDHRAKTRKRKRSVRMITTGRMLPLLGYGFMAYNIMGGATNQAQLREGEGWAPLMAGYAVADAGSAIASGSTPLQALDATLGARQGYGMHDSTNRFANWLGKKL